jgi:hypothetical protein
VAMLEKACQSALESLNSSVMPSPKSLQHKSILNLYRTGFHTPLRLAVSVLYKSSSLWARSSSKSSSKDHRVMSVDSGTSAGMIGLAKAMKGNMVYLHWTCSSYVPLVAGLGEAYIYIYIKVCGWPRTGIVPDLLVI